MISEQRTSATIAMNDPHHLHPTTTPRDGLDWLNDPDGHSDQPWLQASDDANCRHTAFIGNGLIGCRVGPDGDVLRPTDGSGSLMAGFWGTSRRMPQRPEAQTELPQWAGLAVSLGDQREELPLRNRRQHLDFRHAVVTTTATIGNAHIERRCWLARDHKHVGVFSITIANGNSNSRPLRCDIREIFDACDMHAFAIQNANIVDDQLCVEGTEARLGAHLAMASAVTTDLDDTSRIKCLPLQQSGEGVQRRRLLWIKPNETVTITRCVALANSNHSDNPLSLAVEKCRQAIADLQGIWERHVAAWEGLWHHHIRVDHPRLQRVINASLYYLYASLRHDEQYSHGPAGLTNDAWDGTVFWDTELWTLPPLALLQPELALACTHYRYATLDGALWNAKQHDESGARYAWQSAASGRECCVRPTFIEERHIVSCVARGQWLASAASGDHSYRSGPAWQVIRNCAEYWRSRISLDDDGCAHIRQVCGPDEDAGLVDDNAMTNASAAWTLRLAHRMAGQLNEEPHPRWLALADALVIPWDHKRDIPLQMAGCSMARQSNKQTPHF